MEDVVVDGASVDVTAKDVSEVVEVGNESVAGMADEGSKAVEVGAASIVDEASAVVAAKNESVSVEEGLEAAIEGEIPGRVEE